MTRTFKKITVQQQMLTQVRFVCVVSNYQGHFVNKMCFLGVMTTISMLKGNDNDNNRTASVTAGETKEVRSGVCFVG